MTSPRAGIIVANRAYLDHDDPSLATEGIAQGSGGLLQALRPIIAPWDGREGTTWIGAGRGQFDSRFVDGAGYELLATPAGPLRHRRLLFDDPTWRGHYAAASNSYLWPLLHLVRPGLIERAAFYPVPEEPAPFQWRAYVAVNSAFADAVASEPAGDAWVHDYQLGLVPRLLRERGFKRRIGFFLHTPFPVPDIAVRHAGQDGRFREFVHGLLGACLVGMQSAPDRERFIATVEQLRLGERCSDGVLTEGRMVRVGTFPVGVSPGDFAIDAPPAGTAEGKVEGPLVAGLERADVTKGIPERLNAAAAVFAQGRPFTYHGVAAPTREGVNLYRQLELAVAVAAAAASTAARVHGGVFLHERRALPWVEVVALQRSADVVFTSSLADGMNMVPLQAALAQAARPPMHRAAVILGRDTGAAHTYAEFAADGFTIVDPLDAGAMREVLTRAVAGELPRVSDRLIAAVKSRDALSWATSYLHALEESPC
jgi:trehalose-6-phosphate synthase